MPRKLTTQESAVADFFGGMDDVKLECWVSGRHRLPRVLDSRKTTYKKRRDGVIQQIARCEWCRVVVTKLIAPSGYLDEWGGAPSYVYEDGYRIPKELQDGVDMRTKKGLARREARRRNEEDQRSRARGNTTRQLKQTREPGGFVRPARGQRSRLVPPELKLQPPSTSGSSS